MRRNNSREVTLKRKNMKDSFGEIKKMFVDSRQVHMIRLLKLKRKMKNRNKNKISSKSRKTNRG